jgi:hypothetical protein
MNVKSFAAPVVSVFEGGFFRHSVKASEQRAFDSVARVSKSEGHRSGSDQLVSRPDSQRGYPYRSNLGNSGSGRGLRGGTI